MVFTWVKKTPSTLSPPRVMVEVSDVGGGGNSGGRYKGEHAYASLRKEG